MTKNGNSIVAVLDIDYMKDMLVPIVHYEFSKTAIQKSFFPSHLHGIPAFPQMAGSFPASAAAVSAGFLRRLP